MNLEKEPGGLPDGPLKFKDWCLIRERGVCERQSHRKTTGREKQTGIELPQPSESQEVGKEARILQSLGRNLALLKPLLLDFWLPEWQKKFAVLNHQTSD